MAKKVSVREVSSMRKTAETAIRLALMFLLLYWCYGIIKPFIDIIIWTGIFAIALYPAYSWLMGKTGNRKALSIIILLLITLVLLAIPGLLFAQSLFDGISFIKTRFETSDSIIPWDIETVKAWPYVGNFLFEKLEWISEHVGEAIRQYSPQIQKIAVSLISSAASAGLAFIKFIISIAIAGFLLVNSGKASEIAHSVFLKILGENGEDFADTAVNTVRTVLRGILGIAFIQSFLFGLGMIVVGVPAAGLWFILSLVLGIIQAGIFPVSIPVIIYVVTVKDTGTAIPFLIWSLLVSVVDNILRPVLLGRGSGVPMAVVFVGAIGGLLHSGVSGLFTGTVVFAVAYRLFIFWIDENAADGKEKNADEQTEANVEKLTGSGKALK